jgi:uncharacterized protein (TIGR02145 family)
MKKQKINIKTAALLTAALLGTASSTTAQNVSISPTGNAPDNSAALDIRDFTNKGVLIPRLTTAQRNAIPSPANSLLIFNTTTGCYEWWTGVVWVSLGCGCTSAPSAPTAGSHSSTQSSITWVWSAVSTATAYYVNTTNNFATATNVGNTTLYHQMGLSCGQNYTLYVWAQNACGTSTVSTLTFSTSLCPGRCGSQVFMVVNMDVGTMINGANEQNNNSVVEKYCYNDMPANCTTYGGLYQWAEVVQVPYANNNTPVGTQPWMTCDPCGSGGRQGICPAGYHVPTDLEWSRYEWCVENNIPPAGGTSLSTFQTTGGAWRGSTSSTAGVGAKLKASASNSPSWDGTNASGFTALLSGDRTIPGGGFNLAWSFFWAATETSGSQAWSRYLSPGVWQSGRNNPLKERGYSVRCLQN